MAKVTLVYNLAPGEGPEPKHLSRFNLTVVPGQEWRCKNIDFARALVAAHPQIEPADAASARILGTEEEKAGE